jgi:hypothetical protein
MFRVDGADEPYLVALKHHDERSQRAVREFQVLSIIGGSLAPRAVLLDESRTWFPEPVLITTFIEPVQIGAWDDAKLARLARLMASIHTDRRLMKLAIDRGNPPSYSICREFAHEARDLASFRPSPIKDELTRAYRVLEPCVALWEPLFHDGVLVYVHGDLPHHHVFEGKPHFQTIDWEWSRQSHPSRELARALWHLELPPEREAFLLQQYRASAPYAIGASALAVQRALEYFYSALHVTFWLDRATEVTNPNWEKAAGMCRVMRLWIEHRAALLTARL